MGTPDSVSEGTTYRFTDNAHSRFSGKELTVLRLHTDDSGRDMVTVEHNDVSEDEMEMEVVGLNIFRNIVSSDWVETAE